MMKPDNVKYCSKCEKIIYVSNSNNIDKCFRCGNKLLICSVINSESDLI